MSANESHKLVRCTICGCYLTTEDCVDSRCLDPAHWQASGLSAPTDFYALARIMAAGHIHSASDRSRL